MQLTRTFFLAACAVSALAVPVEESTSVKSSRDVLNILEGRAATTDVECKGTEATDVQAYTKKEVKAAYDAGKKKVKTEDCTVTDTSSSVHSYGASDSKVLAALPSECKNLGRKGTLFEYKIKGSDTDRVIWACHKKDGNTAASSDFCLVMTHRGQSNNGFKPCDKK